MFKTPQKSAIVSAAIASTGYVIYILLDKSLPVMLAHYLGTLCIVVLCDLLAKALKTPATTMLFPAMIALAPGIALYQTMYAFVLGDTLGAINMGLNALTIAGCMAIAVASGKMIMTLLERIKRFS